jgi:hypothetical protein
VTVHVVTLEHRLNQVLRATDPIGEMQSIADELETLGVGVESVTTTLKFMERNPDLDFGLPGPLVHFAERFHRRGYEQALLESVRRCPTPHTVWMLHRVINGATPIERHELVEVLRAVVRDPRATKEAKSAAARFLSED